MNEARSILALCGPSGVGKEHIKELIKERVRPLRLSEPLVATTRPVRDGEAASREAGIPVGKFWDRVGEGNIVLPHRPFRRRKSPLYGFVGATFTPARDQLVEVHSSVVERYADLVITRPSMIIGLIAARETLEVNLSDRQKSSSTDNVGLRLDLALIEIDEIAAAHAKGNIDEVFDVNYANRDQQVEEIVSFAEEFYARY